MSKEQEQIEQIKQLQSTTETEITGEVYRNCAKDRLCMLLETAKREQTRMLEHEPHTNRYCAIGALLKSLGYEYKPGQKFARNDKGASFRDIQRYIMARHS